MGPFSDDRNVLYLLLAAGYRDVYNCIYLYIIVKTHPAQHLRSLHLIVGRLHLS